MSELVRIEETHDDCEGAKDPFETIRMAMTAEDRSRVRRKVTAPDGQQFALALPTGTRLWPGQVLYCLPDRIYVIEAAAEKVIVIRPRDIREAAAAGHLVGNMHRDVDLEGDGIAVLYDEVLEQRLLRDDFVVERDERPFHGAAGAGHAH